jgi:hypothetical protein
VPTPRDVLRVCLRDLADTGSQVHAEDVIDAALKKAPDTMAAYGDQLIHNALASQLRAVMRDVTGSDDLADEGTQMALPGIGSVPAYLTIVSPEKPSDRYIRRTLNCTGTELQAAVLTREMHIARAQEARDRLVQLATLVGPDQTVAEFLAVLEPA